MRLVEVVDILKMEGMVQEGMKLPEGHRTGMVDILLVLDLVWYLIQ